MTCLPHRLAGTSARPQLGVSATSIGATGTCQHNSPTEAAGAPNRLTYRFRTSICDAHCTATATSCDACDRGQIDLHCIGCGELKPLNDETFCRKCEDGATLTAADFDLKYNLVPVVHLGPGRLMV